MSDIMCLGHDRTKNNDLTDKQRQNLTRSCPTQVRSRMSGSEELRDGKKNLQFKTSSKFGGLSSTSFTRTSLSQLKKSVCTHLVSFSLKLGKV